MFDPNKCQCFRMKVKAYGEYRCRYCVDFKEQLDDSLAQKIDNRRRWKRLSQLDIENTKIIGRRTLKKKSKMSVLELVKLAAVLDTHPRELL